MTWHVFWSLLPPALYMFLLYMQRREVMALRKSRDSLLKTCDNWKETCRKHIVFIDALQAQLEGRSAEEVEAIMARLDEDDDKKRLN